MSEPKKPEPEQVTPFRETTRLETNDEPPKPVKKGGPGPTTTRKIAESHPINT